MTNRFSYFSFQIQLVQLIPVILTQGIQLTKENVEGTIVYGFQIFKSGIDSVVL